MIVGVEREREGTSLDIPIGVYQPPHILTNQEIGSQNIIGPNGKLLTAQSITNKVGVLKRYVADRGETPLSMGGQATQQIMPGAGREFDFVGVSTSFPTGEHLSTGIVYKLGLWTDRVMDFFAACSGFARMLQHLKENEEEFLGKKVLLVATEQYSPYLHGLTTSFDRTVFSDGAAALSFVYGKSLTILSAQGQKFDPQYNNFIEMPIKPDLMRHPYIEEPVPVSETGFFEMNGPAVYRLMRQAIPELIRSQTRRAGIEPTDIDLVILHQASGRMNNALATAMPEFTVFPDIEEGNLSSASIPKAMSRAIVERRLKAGSKVVLCGFGAGLFASSVIVQI